MRKGYFTADFQAREELRVLKVQAEAAARLKAKAKDLRAAARKLRGYQIEGVHVNPCLVGLEGELPVEELLAGAEQSAEATSPAYVGRVHQLVTEGV